LFSRYNPSSPSYEDAYVADQGNNVIENGRRNGILVITGNHINIFKRPQQAGAKLGAQNGRTKSLTIRQARRRSIAAPPCSGSHSCGQEGALEGPAPTLAPARPQRTRPEAL
jgi:hypothetical protein